MALDFPRIFLLPTHLQPEELHSLEDSIPTLTYNAHEADVVLGKIGTQQRATFELRRLKLETEPLPAPSEAPRGEASRSAKRRKVASLDDPIGSASSDLDPASPGCDEEHVNTVKVVKLAWLTNSLEEGRILPYTSYLLYEGRRIHRGNAPVPVKTTPLATPPSTRFKQAAGGGPRNLASNDTHASSPRARGSSQAPALLHQTTSEHDLVLPPIPAYLTTTYSCQRPTPVDSPNASFIEQLKKVRTLRILQGDQIGVRAYSTSIATIAAYPHPLQGALGWRDLDDVVEYGWQSLTRVQQIGVKYYDDFKLKIPRREVEEIGDVVLRCARQMDPGYQMIIVGGYRRGKEASGDVDVVLSHPDEGKTLHFIEKLVTALEKDRFITHTLTLSTKNSERGQTPVPWRGEGGKAPGFDTLDKALVVWQDPTPRAGAAPPPPHRRVDLIISPWRTAGCAVLGWSGGTTFQRDLRRYCKKEKGLKFDSSGVRSRANGAWVDLEGREGAVAGGPAPDMETAERRVFAGLGLVFRRPEERCTG
ncbi:hypothetical protein S40293_08529 [Stachybotrys chartarum IBT 40293]|nr:hypothetical protein S40293_08529 [Stachybotrys chartarum IBT 40293]